MIVYAFTHFSDTTAWPGRAAVLPVLGTALVILAGTSGIRWDATSVLRLAPLQWIGLISYSLYLVHWPILQSAAAVYGYWRPLPTWATGSLAVASIIVAWAMYAWVERPMRSAKHLQLPRQALLGALGVSAVLVVVSLALVPVASDAHSYVDRAAASTVVLTAPPSQITNWPSSTSKFHWCSS